MKQIIIKMKEIKVKIIRRRKMMIMVIFSTFLQITKSFLVKLKVKENRKRLLKVSQPIIVNSNLSMIVLTDDSL